MSRKRVGLSADALLEVVKGKQFRALLAKASRFTMETGLESSFQYFQDLKTGSRHWTPMFEGFTDRTNWQAAEDWYGSRFGAIRPPDLLNCHFHPDEKNEEALQPSNQDLRGLAYCVWSEYDIRPLVAVGRVSNEGNGALLLLQRCFVGNLNQQIGAADELYERTEEFSFLLPAYEDYAKAIETPGLLKAGILRFEAPRRTGYLARLCNPEVVRRFGC